MSIKRAYQFREFYCPTCKLIMYASKNVHNATKNGHKKTMYCAICKQERNFKQKSSQYM